MSKHYYLDRFIEKCALPGSMIIPPTTLPGAFNKAPTTLDFQGADLGAGAGSNVTSGNKPVKGPTTDPANVAAAATKNTKVLPDYEAQAKQQQLEQKGLAAQEGQVTPPTPDYTKAPAQEPAAPAPTNVGMTSNQFDDTYGKPPATAVPTPSPTAVPKVAPAPLPATGQVTPETAAQMPPAAQELANRNLAQSSAQTAPAQTAPAQPAPAQTAPAPVAPAPPAPAMHPATKALNPSLQDQVQPPMAPPVQPPMARPVQPAPVAAPVAAPAPAPDPHTRDEQIFLARNFPEIPFDQRQTAEGISAWQDKELAGDPRAAADREVRIQKSMDEYERKTGRKMPRNVRGR